MTRNQLVVLAILAASLGATACSAGDATAPRPNLKCENQGSNNFC